MEPNHQAGHVEKHDLRPGSPQMVHGSEEGMA
jgi:hypothetical protein